MRKKRIIVADDEAPIRFAARQLLKDAGYDVAEASNGFEVIRLLEDSRQTNSPVDLVLIDLLMPGCSGEEFLIWLANSPFHPRVLIMTGMRLASGEAKARQYDQMSGILKKPFQRYELLYEVEKALAAPAEPAAEANSAALNKSGANQGIKEGIDSSE